MLQRITFFFISHCDSTTKDIAATKHFGINSIEKNFKAFLSNTSLSAPPCSRKDEWEFVGRLNNRGAICGKQLQQRRSQIVNDMCVKMVRFDDTQYVNSIFEFPGRTISDSLGSKQARVAVYKITS